MKLYNTLGRELQEFKPISDSEVKLYTCGPTVYNYYHIGNLRNAIFNDTLRRALQVCGYNVKHVMNITDVGHLASDMDEGEDKLEAGAKSESKSVWDVANFYIDAFRKDMAELNVLPPNGYDGPTGPYARATDFIAEQQEIIKLLLEKDSAYQTEEAIYFDVTKLPSYGELSGQKLSEKEVGAREEVVKDEQKRNPQDFALWFFLVGRFEDHSMHWKSPWGDGFPGWHLECSAIVHATLGDPIDVHTGGVDHIGTHHANEMAQTEAAYGHKLANYWVHNEHLLVEGHKMSKSLNNSFTLADVKQKGFSAEALRTLYLQSHYRTQSNFSWDSLTAAQYFLKNIQDNFSWIYQSGVIADAPFPGLKETFSDFQSQIKEELADDLDTPGALAVLAKASDGFAVTPASQLDILAVEDFAKFIEQALGIAILDRARYDLPQALKDLVSERDEARSNEDWQKADAIKAELQNKDLELLKDTSHGSIWYRK
jgi:cysteinyl-tRNA synthetase